MWKREADKMKKKRHHFVVFQNLKTAWTEKKETHLEKQKKTNMRQLQFLSLRNKNWYKY